MNPLGYRGALLAIVAGSAAWSFLAQSTPAATSSVHPIVDAQTGYLLGGSRNGKWIRDAETARSLRGGENYRVYRNSTVAGATTGSKTRTDEAPCEDTHWVRLQKNYNGVLAISAEWPVIPRNIRPQNLQQKTYRNEVARILKANGIKQPRVEIVQLWRIDLDGDKTEEVLLSATNYSGQEAGPKFISPNAGSGEYSFVALRKIVNGKVRTIPLAQEYYPQAKTFNAPNVHRLMGAYDLNGDGKMEIVVNSRYYEGESVRVFEVKGASAKEVLSSGCGA